MAKFTEADRAAIRAMRRKGSTYKEISIAFNCSRPLVFYVVNGRDGAPVDQTPRLPRNQAKTDAGFVGPVERRHVPAPHVMPGITLAQLMDGNARRTRTA